MSDQKEKKNPRMTEREMDEEREKTVTRKQTCKGRKILLLDIFVLNQ